MRYRYSKDQLIAAVMDSCSIRQVLKKLGIVPAGGNYQVINKRIKLLNIDTSHFRRQGWSKGAHHTYRLRSLEEILVYGKYENTYRLRNRLLKEGIKEKKCESCNLVEWLGEPMPLELHHIDGNRENNKLENLTMLCPNCYARTKNYRGRNQERCKNAAVLK